MLLSSFIRTPIQPIQHFLHLFAKDGDLVMLVQISPDLLSLVLFLIPQSHSVTREVKLKYFQMAVLFTVGTDSTCVKTEMKSDALVA